MSFQEFIFNKCERILILDTEYRPDKTGTIPKDVLCYVYKDIRSGEIFRYWEYKNHRFGIQHFDLENTLIVCHYALAEVGSYLANLIPLPANIWDTWVEAKNLYNGKRINFSMLDVAREYGIADIMTEEEKNLERDLILNQDIYSKADQKRILNYCERDVHTTGEIFLHQIKDIELALDLRNDEDYENVFTQILTRGRSMADFAKINSIGVPVNLSKLNEFQKWWPEAKMKLINKLNQEVDCFEEQKFNHVKFGELLKREGVYNYWPRTFTNQLSTTEKSFEKFKHIPAIKKVAEIKKLLSQTTLSGYSISENGRSITNLRPFTTSSSRCAPGGKTFPFNASAWIRNLITPPPGFYCVYIDYSSQEPAIQGYLSGDKNLIDAYQSGDIYMHTAKLADPNIPKDATKETHSAIRGIWKVVVLATSYGMGAESVAAKLAIRVDEAKALLMKFKNLYKDYFKYIDMRMNNTGRDLRISTVYGWNRWLCKYQRTTQNSWRNFPIQANGAEILRTAIRKLHDNNFKIAATIHDALLIEIPIAEHKQLIKAARNLMTEAAIEVVGGRIETDYQIIDHKGFTQSKEAQKTFDEIMQTIKSLQTNYQTDSSGLYSIGIFK
jgi:DNA polymerase-1